MTTPVTRCRRSGCNRPLRSDESVARGMSKACALREALRLAKAPYSPEQRAKAEAAIIAKALKPSKREGMYLATSSTDKVTTYLCTAFGCPCRSRRPCWHMCGAALFEAYRKAA